MTDFDEAAISALPEATRQRIYSALRVEQAVAKLGNDPKSRDQVQRLVAEHAPDIASPEAMARKYVSEALGDIKDELKKEREERAREREEAASEKTKDALEKRWMAGRKTLRDAGYQQEGIDAIEKLMEERGIADHEAAMTLHEKLHPPPEPVATGGTRWNFFDRQAEAQNDEAFKRLMANDDEGFLAIAVPAALKEVRGG